MACRGCGNKSTSSQGNKSNMTYAEAVQHRNLKNGYTKTTTFTRSVGVKAETRAKNASLLKGVQSNVK